MCTKSEGVKKGFQKKERLEAMVLQYGTANHTSFFFKGKKKHDTRKEDSPQ